MLCDKPLCLNLGQAVFLFLAGLVGGAMNSVAGGGSFIAFPALLFVGVPAIPANATNTIALWTAAAASGGAYRSRLNSPRRVLIALLAASLAGGLGGALLLLKTPAHTFLRVLPWLTLGATLLFIFARRIAKTTSSGSGHQASIARLAVISLAQFAVGIYGGYFGGGMGIVMLAMLAVGAAGTAYYYYRMTGNPFRMTYQVNRATYATAPYFIWQHARPEPQFRRGEQRGPPVVSMRSVSGPGTAWL